MKKLACIILAAGEGTRLNSNIPKSLHELCGEPLIVHISETIAGLIDARKVIVVGFGGDLLQDELARRKLTQRTKFALQKRRLGTGHAVLITKKFFERYTGDILVLVGDAPLITRETLTHLVERHRRQEAAATVLTTRLKRPDGYGRVLRHQDQSVLKIVEDKDANIYEKKVTEVNTGTYVFDSRQLFKALRKIKPDNEQGEYYLPDVLHVMVKENLRVEALVTRDATEILGINDRKQFAIAERIMRNRILDRLMAQGVTILDPPSTFIDQGVEIGIDSIIQPNTHIRGQTQIGTDCLVGPMTQVGSSEIGDRCAINGSQILQSRVGPDCEITTSYIRGCTIPDAERIGPFANLQELEKSHKGKGGTTAKVGAAADSKSNRPRTEASRRQVSHAKR